MSYDGRCSGLAEPAALSLAEGDEEELGGGRLPPAGAGDQVLTAAEGARGADLACQSDSQCES